MKKTVWLIVIFLSFLPSTHALIPPKDYSQTYMVVINMLKVGNEVIEEKTDMKGTLVCSSEQERDTYGSKEKKRMTIRTKLAFREGELFPVSYSYESSEGTSYDIKTENGQIVKTLKNKVESRESITPLEPDLLLLDLNAFHTIDYWIRKYDFHKGGRQVLKTYLLPAGSIEELTIVPSNIVMPAHETERLQLKNFEIAIGEEMTVLLWIDNDRRLYRLFFRGPNIEVIRSDLFERITAKVSASETDEESQEPDQ